MAKRLAGTAFLAINGSSIALVGDFEWDAGISMRETQSGQDGVHGYSEAVKPGRIKGTIRDMGNFSIAALNGLVDVTITCELANGKRVTGRNMWQVGDLPVNSNQATFELAFEGPQGCVSETLSAT